LVLYPKIYSETINLTFEHNKLNNFFFSCLNVQIFAVRK
jgi:hypothetical protein